MSDRLLVVSNLDVSYGKVRVVRGVDLRVRAGEIVALIGPNGAGKTTLLQALVGILPSAGRVLYDEVDIERWDVEARVAAGLALVPETRELFGSMSVADNLLLGGFMHRRRTGYRLPAERRRIYDLFPRLRERAHQRTDQLSGGERQMLAIGRALMGRPRLLMLDEPSLGLAPLIVRETFQMLDSLRRGGSSLLLVEQNARAALRVADYAYVIEQGEIVLAGAASELARDPRVAATYLGLARRAGSAA
jgi:branched-chain amino acid transport system ATP-binding protein